MEILVTMKQVCHQYYGALYQSHHLHIELGEVAAAAAELLQNLRQIRELLQ